ncbi:DNA-processing protein DprA [Parafrankia sp. FMc2]|uniref:DNA-processing protein DprA n=1 Tax=Parafrankia sp. FMc2 TaxID=3233196 RepID=UPI0034D47A1A
MDRLTEHAALLTLLRGRRRQWGHVADEVEEAGSALRVLEADTNTDQGDLFEGFSDGIGAALDTARETLLGWDAQGIRIVTLLDADYPAQLLTVHQRPPFLFFRGQMSPDDATGVAVVGTRSASTEGLRRADEIAAGLARRGRVVVSGLAAGIDTVAHRAALREGGRTVAVIGTGLLKSYPKENAPLQEKLAREQLVLSQFWPDSPPTRTSFLMRNGVMSGYAAATVVVEAPEKSGARTQARLALEHGRPVFLLDTVLVHAWAQEYAHRPGVTVVSSAEEVLNLLDDLTVPPDEVVWS